MPAVAVPDLTVLPRVDQPAPDLAQRPVVSVTTAPHGLEGEGFPVRRAFAGVAMADGPKDVAMRPQSGAASRSGPAARSPG